MNVIEIFLICLTWQLSQIKLNQRRLQWIARINNAHTHTHTHTWNMTYLNQLDCNTWQLSQIKMNERRWQWIANKQHAHLEHDQPESAWLQSHLSKSNMSSHLQVNNDKHVEHDPASKLINASGYVFLSANAHALFLVDATQRRHMFHVSRKSVRRNKVDIWIIWQVLGYCGQDKCPMESHTWNTCFIKLLQFKPTALLEALQQKSWTHVHWCMLHTQPAGLWHQWSCRCHSWSPKMFPWLLTYQLRVSSSSTPDLQRLLSRATKSSKRCCDLVGSDKWPDWGHWR